MHRHSVPQGNPVSNPLRCCLLALAVLLMATAPAAPAAQPSEALAAAAQDYLGIDILAPPGALPGRNFGHAIAIEGDLAVIGANSERQGDLFLHGAVYVFTQADGRWRQRARLAPADGNASLQFGSSVAIASGQILVGAPGFAAGGTARGALFAYDGSGASWTETQRLVASGSIRQLGYSMAVGGDTLLAGAPDEDETGAAHVYVRVGGNWVEQATLTATVPGQGDQFGRVVAIDGDTAAVAAPFEGTLDTGAAYVFTRAAGTWAAPARLAPSADPGANSGWSLAVTDALVLVGAPRHDSNGIDRAGAVFVHAADAGGWSLQQTLANPRQANVQFGDELVFDDGRLFIGEPGSSRAWGRRGRIYTSALAGGSFGPLQAIASEAVSHSMGISIAVSGSLLLSAGRFDRIGEVSGDGRVAVHRFDGSRWQASGWLHPALTPGTQRFGVAVALSGQRAAVGTPWRSVDGMEQRGAVHVFDFDGQRWRLAATVVDAQGAAGDRFGSSIALDGDRLLVGAPWRDNTPTAEGGSAVLYEHDGSTWNPVYRHDNAFREGDRMGEAVALAGDRAAVGAPYYTGALDGQGRVLLLERSAGSWTEAGNLFGDTSGERLGSALALTSSSVAAGAPDADAGDGRVRMYRFVFGNWAQVASIAAPAGAAGFGSALAAQGNLLAVGAPLGDGGAGRVALYREGTLGVSAEALPPVSGMPRALGSAVALSGELLVAGALNNGSQPATLHLFAAGATGAWDYLGRRDSPDGSPALGDGFGGALALGPTHLLAGAQFRADAEGRVFAYMAPAETVLTVASVLPAQPLAGEPFTVTVQVGSAGPAPDGTVRIALPGAAGCSATLVAGEGQCTLEGTLAGPHQILVDYAPDSLPLLPASLQHPLTVDRAATTLVLSSTPASVHPGEALVLEAALSVDAPGSGTPTGQVSFHRESVANPALCVRPAAAASCALTAPPAGTASYVAHYLGDGNFLAADSAVLDVAVDAWPTTTTILGIAPEGGRVGDMVQVQVQVAAPAGAALPSGRVRAGSGGSFGTWVLLDGSGHAQAALALQVAGEIAVVAEFEDPFGNYLDSQSAAAGYQVAALQATVHLSAVPNTNLQAGDPVDVAISVSLEDAGSATGMLSLHLDSSGNAALCSVAAPAGSCPFVLPRGGDTTLVARYGGDARAAAAEQVLTLSAVARPSTTVVSSPTIAPTVDGQVRLEAVVSSDWEIPQGTVLMRLGSRSCEATVSPTGTAACTVIADFRGERPLQAEYLPGDARHAASEASGTLSIAGLDSFVDVELIPGGPYRVGQVLSARVTVADFDGELDGGGMVTLRLQGAEGPVICTGSPPVLICANFTIDAAGPLVLYADYEGDARHEPGFAQVETFASQRESVIVWHGSDPAPVVQGEPWSVSVEVHAHDDPEPAGVVDFSAGDDVLCAGVGRDDSGRFRCAQPGLPNAFDQYIDVAFRSADANASDASLNSRIVHVVEATVMVRVDLDNGVDSVRPGDLLSYLLDVRNVGGEADAHVALQMEVPAGLADMAWRCIASGGGALCPQPTSGNGAMLSQGELPPGGDYLFEVTALVAAGAPAQIEASALAEVLRQVNDDPGMLLGVDLDFNVEPALFADGFE